MTGVLAFFERDASIILWDLADILLVALVLYYVLLVLKGTQAMQMGLGLGVVFIVYQASKRLGLVTLYAMLDTFLTSLVLIIIVIFQHDIRRALMRFGRGTLFTPARVAVEPRVIDEVVRAAAALAKRHIGALIVIEREAALDDFVEHGATIDAGVSKELLYSIFIPTLENPVHDGAVIIRDGRLWQAGAFLPLARSFKLDRSLGTRHRAAIGLTEETDAVVVVVSEERGAISLAFNGNIARNLDPTSLRKVLIRLSQKRHKKKASRTDKSPRSEMTADSGSADRDTDPRGPRSADRKSEPSSPGSTGPWQPMREPGSTDRKSEPSSPGSTGPWQPMREPGSTDRKSEPSSPGSTGPRQPIGESGSTDRKSEPSSPGSTGPKQPIGESGSADRKSEPPSPGSTGPRQPMGASSSLGNEAQPVGSAADSDPVGSSDTGSHSAIKNPENAP